MDRQPLKDRPGQGQDVTNSNQTLGEASVNVDVEMLEPQPQPPRLGEPVVYLGSTAEYQKRMAKCKEAQKVTEKIAENFNANANQFQLMKSNCVICTAPVVVPSSFDEDPYAMQDQTETIQFLLEQCLHVPPILSSSIMFQCTYPDENGYDRWTGADGVPLCSSHTKMIKNAQNYLRLIENFKGKINELLTHVKSDLLRSFGSGQLQQAESNGCLIDVRNSLKSYFKIVEPDFPLNANEDRENQENENPSTSTSAFAKQGNSSISLSKSQLQSLKKLSTGRKNSPKKKIKIPGRKPGRPRKIPIPNFPAACSQTQDQNNKNIGHVHVHMNQASRKPEVLKQSMKRCEEDEDIIILDGPDVVSKPAKGVSTKDIPVVDISQDEEDNQLDDSLVNPEVLSEFIGKIGSQVWKICGQAEANQRKLDSLILKKAPLNKKRKRLMCRKCYHTFDSTEARSIHEATHEPGLTFKCGLCNRSFFSIHALPQHRRVAHRDNPGLKCDECHRTFNYRSELNKHKKRFHNPQNEMIKCSKCDKVLKGPIRLQKHMILKHTKKPRKPKCVCRICLKFCKTRAELGAHMASDHPQNWKPSLCEICGKELSDPSSLNNHKRSQHLNDFKFTCEVCGSRALYKSHLEAHQLKYCKRPIPGNDNNVDIKPSLILMEPEDASVMELESTVAVGNSENEMETQTKEEIEELQLNDPLWSEEFPTTNYEGSDWFQF